MLTDEELTSELKLAFDDATQDIAALAGLGVAVRRRHRADRRRAGVLRIAVPAAAAACAGGAAVAAGTGSGPSSHTPAAQHSLSSVPVLPSSRPHAKTVAYLLKVPAQAPSDFGCLDRVAVQVTRDADTWRVSGPDNCLLMLVDTSTLLPDDVQPIELAGVPGLYGTTDEAAGMRTIYSRNGDGSWSSLTVAADTAESSLRGFYVPAADGWMAGGR
jgi:hypothetical protein